MWFGIIVFGVVHGFMFLPILLSYFGPTGQTTKMLENKVHIVIDKKETDDGAEKEGKEPVKTVDESH